MAERRSQASRVAVVTGAVGGIGRAICTSLAQAGYDVIGVDRVDAGDLPSGRYVRADLTDPNARVPLLDAIEAGSGPIAVPINNAVHLDQSPFAERMPDSMMETLKVNVVAVALLCRAVATPRMRAAGGVIVNIASIAGKRGSSQPIYAASRAGAIGLTKTLARLYAPNVRVVEVAPALVEAGMGQGLSAEVQTPLGRAAATGEIAAVVAFLASPAASYVNEETVDVHGGL